MAHTDEQWARISRRAKETKAAQLSPHVVVILARPGQSLNEDAKSLRENFGITPDQVTTLDKTSAAPVRITEDNALPLTAGLATLQGATLEQAGVSSEEHQAALDRIAELEAELDATQAEGEGSPKGK